MQDEPKGWGVVMLGSDHSRAGCQQARAWSRSGTFLEASQEIRFQGQGRAEVYARLTRILR